MQMINTNIVQQIMFTDTISFLIKKKSIQNYVIIESDAHELEAITVSLWIKTTQNDAQVYFITYAAADSPHWKKNTFAISTYNGQLRLTIAHKTNKANR